MKRKGKFMGMAVFEDDTLPPNTMQFRDSRGKVLGSLTFPPELLPYPGEDGAEVIVVRPPSNG